MKAGVAAIVLGFAALAPQAVHAQAAKRDPNSGKLYCYAKDLFLQESTDGLLDATLYLWNPGDTARTVYPAGTGPLLASDAQPYIEIGYSIPFDRTGKPTARPRPVQISVSPGKFAAAPPGPRLTLQIKAGDILTPPIAITPSINSWADTKTIFRATGSPDPGDNEIPQPTLNRLAMALESGERFVLLSQHGKEIARIPIPQRSIAADRDAGIAWFTRTAPLLAAGKCS